jgi:RHS repeat-associated protein
MGDRLSTAASTGFAWIVPDLHGNVAAQCSSAGSVSDVFRYDAYGKLIGTSLPAGTVPSPWRFQGRILESTAGSDTYDFGARAYVPDLGTFTSLDSVAGSAQNPLTLNRYLYANANPATLVDPDGHCASGYANTWNFDTRSLACTPTAMTLIQNQATAEHARNKYLNGQLNADFKKSVADAKAAAAKPRDCGFLGSGCLDDPGKAVGGFTNGLNQGWQHSVGGLVNNVSNGAAAGVYWASKHMDLVIAGVVLVVACVAACLELAAAAGTVATLAAAGEFGMAATLGCAAGCAALATLAMPTLAFTAQALHDTVDPSIDAAGIGFAMEPSMDWNWSPYSAEGRWNLRNPDGSGQFISAHDYAYPPGSR